MTSEYSIDEFGHNRMICCPDDPTCPWPDACDICGQDWPCPTIRIARAYERARLAEQARS